MDVLVQEPLYDPGHLPSEVKTVDVQMIVLPSSFHNDGNYIRQVVYVYESKMLLPCVVKHGTIVTQRYFSELPLTKHHDRHYAYGNRVL